MDKANSIFFMSLECNDGSYYAGYTNNLEKRIRTHNEGKGAKYTRAKIPVRLIYRESFQTKQDAMQAEYQFKQLTGSKRTIYGKGAKWMKSQKSAEPGGGKLFLVGTPIGNLEDMTFRAIRILKEADMIAAEDTRNTIRLCNHFEIKTPLMSYHEHNIEKGGEKILVMIAEGKQLHL